MAKEHLFSITKDGSMISIDKTHEQDIEHTSLYVPVISNILNNMEELNYVW